MGTGALTGFCVLWTYPLAPRIRFLKNFWAG